MKRRTFLKNTGMLGAASLLPLNSCATNTMPKYKMGLQLFSIHQEMLKNTLVTLTAVKEMGYEDFEIYGFDPDQVTYYGLPATEFKQMLDDLGLTATSGKLYA